MATAALDVVSALNLQQAIARKDVSAVTSALESLNIPDVIKFEIAALSRLFGGTEVLAKADATVSNDRSKKALENLKQVVDILAIHGIRDELTVDLGEIRGLAYHSGVTFEAFVPGLGEPVCGGGRYDGLMGRYGKDLPATGFAFNLLGLLHGLEKSSVSTSCHKPSLLVFNMKDDRSEALELATKLRSQGCPVTRDIIRRDFDQSLEYARTAGIGFVATIGAAQVAEDEVQLVRVADGAKRTVCKDVLMAPTSAELFREWTAE